MLQACAAVCWGDRKGIQVKSSAKDTETIRVLIRSELFKALLPTGPELPDELTAAWESGTLRAAVRLFEQAFILRRLREKEGDRDATAATLGIGYSTLKAKLRGVKVPRLAPPLLADAGRPTTRDMRCRIQGCDRRSKGPRYGYVCENHLSLPANVRREAIEAWRSNH
jgi:hypothetical protein